MMRRTTALVAIFLAAVQAAKPSSAGGGGVKGGKGKNIPPPPPPPATDPPVATLPPKQTADTFCADMSNTINTHFDNWHTNQPICYSFDWVQSCHCMPGPCTNQPWNIMVQNGVFVGAKYIGDELLAPAPGTDPRQLCGSGFPHNMEDLYAMVSAKCVGQCPGSHPDNCAVNFGQYVSNIDAILVDHSTMIADEEFIAHGPNYLRHTNCVFDLANATFAV